MKTATGFLTPITMKEFMDGWQICYPVDFPIEKRVVSVIEHYGSYGHAQDTLEIMGLLTDEERRYDSVVGSLTAQDVFDRIQKHYAGVLEKEAARWNPAYSRNTAKGS